MVENKKFNDEVRILAESTRKLIPLNDLANPKSECCVVLTTDQHEYVIAVKSDATALRITDRQTGTPLFATGWPYLGDSEDNQLLREALDDLHTMLRLLSWKQSPNFQN